MLIENLIRRDADSIEFVSFTRGLNQKKIQEKTGAEIQERDFYLPQFKAHLKVEVNYVPKLSFQTCLTLIKEGRYPGTPTIIPVVDSIILGFDDSILVVGPMEEGEMFPVLGISRNELDYQILSGSNPEISSKILEAARGAKEMQKKWFGEACNLLIAERQLAQNKNSNPQEQTVFVPVVRVN